MQTSEVRISDTTVLVIASAFVGALTLIACRIWKVNGDDPPWVADHAVISGLAAFAICAVVGRVYLFMRRLEDRS